MTVRVTAAELAAVRDQLAALLDEIGAGRMTCSAATRHRIEGAVITIESLTGGTADRLAERLGNDRMPDTSE